MFRNIGLLAWGMFFCCLISYAQQTSKLYIGTYTNSGSHGIYVADFDQSTGRLRITDSIAAEQPSYLALNKAGNRLYAVNENGGSKPGMVSSFLRDDKTGKWLPLNNQPVKSEGDHPCYISIDHQSRFAMVANYSGGSLTVLPIDKQGALGNAVQVLQQQGQSINAERQQAPHVHTAIFAPKEKYVIIADLGADKIKAYPFDGSKPLPLDTNKVISISTAAGAGPRHIAFHPSRPLFYVMEELSGNVTVYGFNKRTIARLQTIKADSISRQPGSADIHVSADGRFLYASNRMEANNIAVFSISGSSGKLSYVGVQPTMGLKPRNFTIDPSGKYLLVANQDSDSIVVFAIDAATGMPMPTGHSVALPSPVCLVFAHH